MCVCVFLTCKEVLGVNPTYIQIHIYIYTYTYMYMHTYIHICVFLTCRKIPRTDDTLQASSVAQVGEGAREEALLLVGVG